MDNIQKRLKKWRDDRKITMDIQRDNLLSNVLEELTEYSRARTNYDNIDALCDICVFVLNAYEYKEEYTVFDIQKHNGEIIECDRVELDDTSPINISLCVLHSLDEINMGDKKYASIIVKTCLNSIRDFTEKEPIECLRETIKEIESRTGKYIEEKGKFIKDKGEYIYTDALSKLREQYGDNVSCIGDTENKWIFNVNGKIQEIVKWYKADYGV